MVARIIEALNTALSALDVNVRHGLCVQINEQPCVHRGGGVYVPVFSDQNGNVSYWRVTGPVNTSNEDLGTIRVAVPLRLVALIERDTCDDPLGQMNRVAMQMRLSTTYVRRSLAGVHGVEVSAVSVGVDVVRSQELRGVDIPTHRAVAHINATVVVRGDASCMDQCGADPVVVPGDCPDTTVNGVESETHTIAVLQGGSPVGALDAATGIVTVPPCEPCPPCDDAEVRVNGVVYDTVAPGDDIDIQVVRASDNSAIGTVTPGVSVSIPSGRAMTTNGLVEVVSVPPGVDVPLPQSVINYITAAGLPSPTPMGPYNTLYSAGTLKGGAAPRFVVRRASDGTTIIATGDIANPFVELSPQEVRNSADAVVSYHEVDDPGVAPDATIQLKDSGGTNIGSPVSVPSGTSANITAPDGTVTVRNLNGTALGSPSVKSNGTANYTAQIPMKMGWGAGDADTLEWTVTDAEAGTYNSYTQDGGSGTITYSKNGAAFAALSGTITLAVGNTIKVRRTTTTNAGYSTWAP